MRIRLAGAGACLFAAIASIAGDAVAQSYPAKPVRIVVPYTPGGGNDLFGRAVAQKMSERLGQPVIVENKPGAGGNIGVEFVAKSPPDGYTLLVAQNGLTMQPWVSKSLPFDVVKDLAPVGIGVTLPMVVVVTNSLPVKSVGELVAYARHNPGRISYATPGIGTPHHLATEWLQEMTGTRMVQIPYAGAARMLPDLMSGNVHLMIGALNSAAQHIQAGKIRAIAVAERQRLPQMKDVATVSETLPGYDVNLWYGLMAPAGTPEAVVNRVSDEMRQALNQPDVRERLVQVGFDINPTSAAEMRRILNADLERWRKVVKAAGIQPE